MAAGDILRTAQRLADEILFPAALATDAADTVPVELLDALAGAGFYGLSGPGRAGGLEADFPTVCGAVEALASGCLTTTFVWAQHLGAVSRAAGGFRPGIEEAWLGPLCSGAQRAGLALGGSLPGPAQLRAHPAADGWLFEGDVRWLSGWGRIDIVHAAARAPDGSVVWAFVDARESPTLVVERLRLVGIDSSATVRASFRNHVVPAERVAAIVAPGDREAPDTAVLRVHASFALGLIGRCCRLLGPSSLDAELEHCRAALDTAEPEGMPVARAAAGELALRAAARLMVADGSGSVLPDHHGQRLAREALFLLVYGSRESVRGSLLGLLAR